MTMGTVSPFENYTLFVNSGAVVFSGTTYDYRYYRMVVTGAQSAVVNLTLNGVTMDLAGTTVIDAPIYSLTVNSGAGVLLFGTRSVREIFGN
jgi:hypothetical protein